MEMVPLKDDSSPSIHFRSVDLPQPTGPSTKVKARRRMFQWSMSMTGLESSDQENVPFTEAMMFGARSATGSSLPRMSDSSTSGPRPAALGNSVTSLPTPAIWTPSLASLASTLSLPFKKSWILWKEAIAEARSGSPMTMPTNGWFTSINKEYAVNAFWIVKVSLVRAAVVTNVLKVRIGDQIGVQIT